MRRIPGRPGETRETAKTASEEDPSPSAVIESVVKGTPGTVIVAAGGSSFIVDPAQCEELGVDVASLAVGMPVDGGTASILKLAAEAHEAERRGLALLARAEQSSFMLRIKLEQRGFPGRAVGLALERLEAEGSLDDRRFARAYASSRLERRVEGPASLEAALRARGIAADTAKEAIRAVLDPEARKTALAKAYQHELKRRRRVGARDGADGGGGEEGSRIESTSLEIRSALRELGYSASEITEFFENDQL